MSNDVSIIDDVDLLLWVNARHTSPQRVFCRQQRNDNDGGKPSVGCLSDIRAKPLLMGRIT